jgi:hypothetical protein
MSSFTLRAGPLRGAVGAVVAEDEAVSPVRVEELVMLEGVAAACGVCGATGVAVALVGVGGVRPIV